MDNRVKITMQTAGQSIVVEGDKSILFDMGIVRTNDTGLEVVTTPTPSEINLRSVVLYACVAKELDALVRDLLNKKDSGFITEGQVINALLMDSIKRHKNK